MNGDRVIRRFIFACINGALRCMTLDAHSARKQARFEIDCLATWVACAARDGHFALAQRGGICFTELELLYMHKDWWQDALPAQGEAQ